MGKGISVQQPPVLSLTSRGGGGRGRRRRRGGGFLGPVGCSRFWSGFQRTEWPSPTLPCAAVSSSSPADPFVQLPFCLAHHSSPFPFLSASELPCLPALHLEAAARTVLLPQVTDIPLACALFLLPCHSPRPARSQTPLPLLTHSHTHIQTREVLMEESNVQPVRCPVTVCGDIHGQFVRSPPPPPPLSLGHPLVLAPPPPPRAVPSLLASLVALGRPAAAAARPRAERTGSRNFEVGIKARRWRGVGGQDRSWEGAAGEGEGGGVLRFRRHAGGRRGRGGRQRRGHHSSRVDPSPLDSAPNSSPLPGTLCARVREGLLDVQRVGGGGGGGPSGYRSPTLLPSPPPLSAFAHHRRKNSGPCERRGSALT